MSHSKESDELVFFVNGRKIVERSSDPEENLLFYLRKKLRLTGTKYGCGGGSCGACTVMISRYDPISKKIRHFSVTACLVPICSLYGAAVTTVEGIGSTKTRIHPVQERIAKGHGTQCGFCTPGMVMSIYTLLRNHPEPSTEQLMETLGGNLCRCTGYRPIVESGRSFSPSSSCCQMNGGKKCCLDQEESKAESKANVCTKLYDKEEFQPLDPTQELIFPPELMRMAEDPQKKVLTFHGEKTTWISPGTLAGLLELKMEHPDAPLVMGNTSLGPDMKFKGVSPPIIISPARILELFIVTNTEEGLTLGAGLRLAQVRDVLADAVSELPEEKTQTYRALLKHMRTLAGQQIRNMASLGGHIISRLPTSDLNPILGVGNCILNVASKEGMQQIPLNDHFLAGATNASLKPEQVLVSVFIPISRKWEFVSAFRQAPRQQNALAIVNAGMRVLLKDGTHTIADLNILYGGVGPTTVSARESCQRLLGRCWDEDMLNEACRLVLDEIPLPASAPGGRVDYRRALLISFLFKFYIDVWRQLQMREPSGYPDIPKKLLSALEDFPLTIPWGIQSFERMDPQQPSQDPVGRPIMHQSGIKHATGEAVFCDDMPALADELFLAVVTSTRPHAKIISIDASEALALPGVIDVITAQDVPGENGSEEERLYAQDEVVQKQCLRCWRHLNHRGGCSSWVLFFRCLCVRDHVPSCQHP